METSSVMEEKLKFVLENIPRRGEKLSELIARWPRTILTHPASARRVRAGERIMFAFGRF